MLKEKLKLILLLESIIAILILLPFFVYHSIRSHNLRVVEDSYKCEYYFGNDLSIVGDEYPMWSKCIDGFSEFYYKPYIKD